MANPPDGDGGVGGEVLRLDKVVSQKFVPEPKDAQPILRSLFVALGRFEHCVRWKKYHFDRYVEEQTKARGETLNLLSGSDVSGSSQESDSSRQVRRSERIRELEEKRIRKLAVEFADADEDLGDDEKDPRTGLKAEGSEPIAPTADSETEMFLKEVRKALLGRFKDGLINTAEPSELDREIRAVLRELEKQDNTVVVPSDKTNRMIPVKLDWYIKRMEKCISDDAAEVDKEFLDFSYDQAATELKDLADGMEKSDVDYIESQMATHAIPRCFGLVKDHQPEKMDEEGNFPTRFVVPDNNFMAGFANVGYRLIKGIFAKYGVEYSAYTIKNAEDLLRYLKIDRDLLDRGKCTFVSLDAIKMYPSIKIETISRAVHFFAKDLPVHEKEKVDKALELLTLSLKSTFFTFGGKYYHYNAGVEEEDDIGLTIGGCASAWLADLVISWIFYKNKKYIYIYIKMVSQKSALVLKAYERGSAIHI